MGLAPAVVRLASSPGADRQRQDQAQEVSALTVVRVLVVDDVAAFLVAMVSVVGETPGFEVVAVASSGEEAVAVAAEAHPDLVLMDVNLPRIDGLEATRRLLRGAQAPTVLLLSTYDDDIGDQLVAESGAAAYLHKAALGPDRLQQAWSDARR